MSGLRAAYAASLALLVLLALATLASPIILPTLRREGAPLPEAGKLQVLAKEDEWVLQYNLVNPSTVAGAYVFELAAAPVSLASTPDAARVLHTRSVFVDAGRPYVFIYHLRPEAVPEGRVRFTVQRGDEPTPIEDLALHLTAGRGAR